MTLQETVWMVEEEAYASREAWAHSIGLSQATHQELQTYRDHMYAHETHLQAHQTQLQLQGTLIQTHHQMVETLRVIRDMRREMSDMQAELLSLREQQRRARQPGPEARILDHHDASRDADSHIYGCAIENQVKFATCTLLGAALTWWNGQIRTLGPEAYAMTWEVLKKKMTDKYCPQGEIKKLEIELWNLKVKGNDVPAYTERFQELTLICTKFVANETEKVDKYISGLPDNIYGNVKSARPKTLDETIELANDLMDQKLRTYTERQSNNKRKADDSSRNNHGHQQQPFKRQNVAKVYNIGTGERKPYGGSLPKCTKCHLHHNGPCTQRCHKCNKVGHFARDCRSTGNTNVTNTQKGNRAAHKGNGCFEYGAPGHFKRDCPKLKNKDGGNGNAQGWVYAVGNAEKGRNASGNPDANVITVAAHRSSSHRIRLLHPRNEGLIEATTLAFCQRIHKTKFLTLGTPVLFCQKEGMGQFSGYAVTKEPVINSKIDLEIRNITNHPPLRVREQDNSKRIPNLVLLVIKKVHQRISKIAKFPNDGSYSKGNQNVVAYCKLPQQGLGAVLMQRDEGKYKRSADAMSAGTDCSPLRFAALVLTIGFNIPKRILEARSKPKNQECVENEE
ncbi:putative reverse transcriptase domain-containing protein [Tanacetum coccineum]